MRLKHLFLITSVTVASFAIVPAVVAQGTAFTYQGQLLNGTNPATGTYDLSFSLYDASANGDLLAGPMEKRIREQR